MLIKNEKLAVCPITTHVDIKNISKKINQEKIIQKNLYDKFLVLKNSKKPNFAVLGLNPHNAELRKNSEENKIIVPVLTKLKKRGFLSKVH